MVSVRMAVPEDAAEVAGVHVRSWQVAYRGLLASEYLDGLRPEDRMARYTFDATDPDGPVTMVAVENDLICGFATTGPSRDADTNDAGEVLALYVDPGAWGHGIGRLLMREARAHLAQQRFTEAVLWVLDGNDRAQRFYLIDGWRPDDRRRTEEVWGVSVDEVRYRRKLA
jgi:GNAT superfamily N-acetyltransferase